MNLQNETELANTREKLNELETRYKELRLDITENPHIRELTLQSLKKLINQLKEEITLFSIRQS